MVAMFIFNDLASWTSSKFGLFLINVTMPSVGSLESDSGQLRKSPTTFVMSALPPGTDFNREKAGLSQGMSAKRQKAEVAPLTA